MNYIIIFPVIVFVINAILVYLNISNKNNKESIDSLFDENEIQKFKLYGKDKSIAKIIHIFFVQSLLIFVILYLYKFLEINIQSSIPNIYINTSVIIFILYTLYQLISSLYEAYDMFYIEEKYGFNNTTLKLFMKDQLLDYIVTTFFVLLTINFLLFLYINLDATFLIYGGIFITVLLILYNIFFVIIFIPLLFKTTPLDNQELIDDITLLADKESFTINQIVTINASERSTKINAYFSGFGKTKKVMLFDTLIEKLSTKQIVAVTAHEVGHSKYKHMLKDLLFDIAKSLSYLVIFYMLLSSNVSIITGGINTFASSVIGFITVFGIIQIILKTISNTISRHHEKSADLYVKNIGLGKELSDCMVVGAKSNLVNLHPHPVFVFFKFDHPPLKERLTYLK